MTFLFHEERYRSAELMQKLQQHGVTVCGAGALGANLVENLARSGFNKLKVIDFDRIEERNLSTQPYYRSDVGAFKAKILANQLYRAIGLKLEVETKKLTATNVEQQLQGSALVIEAFDNSVARQVVKDYCDRANLPCLHAGLAADYAEVIWNSCYRVPSNRQDDVCDYPLARNLVMLTIAITSEAAIDWIATGAQRSFTITLKDLSIQEFS